MIRLVVAVLLIVGLVLTATRRGRRKNPEQPEPRGKKLQPSWGQGEDGAGDRSPLDPDDPQLSGGAAKKLGEDE